MRIKHHVILIKMPLYNPVKLREMLKLSNKKLCTMIRRNSIEKTLEEFPRRNFIIKFICFQCFINYYIYFFHIKMDLRLNKFNILKMKKI